MTRGLWITGLVLMVSPLLLSTFFLVGGDGFEAIIEALIFTFVIGPILFLTGLVLLIVGLAKGGGQQQQQQVVVYTDGAAQSRFCSSCGDSLGGGQRFCTGCGVSV